MSGDPPGPSEVFSLLRDRRPWTAEILGGESVGVGTSDPLRNPSTKNRWGIYRGNSPAIFGVSAL